ncbi:hypothetical protein [Corallococcus llansteffanensis]|uniref:Uncharacterized protein n=1 Tax=Corallococcus llansteffanensis TaxID=2316731 RepID=A0A3A8N8M7_9BACT|nr:hypothetical protein [Corallococcus llansteffanensis]RKH40658.1 hypothetical protein D7V93_39355 [Corallococcus llansteffanensis]
MTERDAYIQTMEAEQRAATARFLEIEAQAGLAESEDELDLLFDARERSDDFHREVQALRHADHQDWHRAKADAEKARTRFDDALDRAGDQWELLRAGYRREREAELRHLGALVALWEAAQLLSRHEVELLKRGLQDARGLLMHLGRSHGAAWTHAREDYEATWRDLRAHTHHLHDDNLASLS